jgi:hypothetical protein
MNLQKVIDEEHPRFGQVGEYDRQWVIPGSKPDLHCHTVKFEGGETEQFLSYQIEPASLQPSENQLGEKS